MDQDDLLEEVERNIASPIDAISFSPALEDYYRTSIAAGRRSSMLIAGGIGMVVLWIFILQQAVLIVPTLQPTDFRLWLFLMGGLNLLIGGYVAVHLFVRSHRLRDGVTMSIMSIMPVMICGYFYFEPPELRVYGMFSYVMMPVACNNLVWLHFRQALFVTLVSFACWGVFLASTSGDGEVRFVSTLVLVSAGAMALWANWRTDRGERAMFLWLTRERRLAELSRRLNAELREMSDVDPLTGIANRRAFEERFRALTGSGVDEAEPVVVMMIDIDHFKLFNDHYGHLDGDHCLQCVARALAEQLRGPQDLIARLGGEEFVIVMPRLARADVEPVLERIRRAVEDLAIPHEGVRADPRDVLTISIGCAVSVPDEGERRRALLRLADRALYRAKREGRNRWRIA